MPIDSVTLSPEGRMRDQRTVAYAVWLVFLLTAFSYFLLVRDGGDDWITGDWLISYSEGPVRRGLMGTLLLQVASLGLPLQWVAFGVQVSIQAAVVALILRIYSARPRGAAWLLILGSPVFLVFPLLNSEAAFRKEILIYLSLAILCASYARQRMTTGALVMAALTFVIAAFSHELAAFVLPFFVYICLQLARSGAVSQRVSLALAAFFVLAALGGVAFSIAFPADPSLTSALCRSLLERGLPAHVCEGAIASLNVDTTFWFQEKEIVLWRYASFYAVALVIALVPLRYLRWRGRERMALAASGLLCMVVLSAIAIDWGRWLHVYISCLFCIALAESAADETIDMAPVPMVVIALYVTAWSVPHCCSYSFEQGLLRRSFELARTYVSLESDVAVRNELR